MVERRKITISGISNAPGYERYLGPRSEAEKMRCQAISAALDEAQRKNPGMDVKIEYRAGEGFTLLIGRLGDLAFEQRLAKVKEIYEKRGESQHRLDVKNFFFY
jgi:hypothetical protein